MNADILSFDPILSDHKVYDEVRKDYKAIYSASYSNILYAASQTDPGIAQFCNLLANALEDLSAPLSFGADPYFSSVFMSWINGLKRGLDWVSLGAEVECMKFFSDSEAFLKDLSLEYPAYLTGHRNHFNVNIDDTINIIPVQFLLESPRMGGRVSDCLPEISSPGLFTKADEKLLDGIKDHIQQALKLIYELSPKAYEIFKKNIHSIYVGLYEFNKNSFGTRKDYPGIVIAGLSRNRIDKGDFASTAAELYHEHCHIKLCLFCEAKNIALPTDLNLVSPFKNEIRDFETALHTVYTITIECYLRLLLLRKQSISEQNVSLSYLAAVGFRLEIFQEILANTSAVSICEEFTKVISLSGFVLSQISDTLKSLPKSVIQAHKTEKLRVMKRHIWDIGQFLCRGLSVYDPHVSRISLGENSINYYYKGVAYNSGIEKRKITRGDYGSYTQKIFEADK
ncbi:hypothetical protein EXU57_24490 [Segetibacter sp. 3557_3]|uniref:hypothetical protein n=1 Tax=Segetibacter sp. 3557_3 TaxID=2547429 RepID=UPI001058CE66|nr:hypothetical protein [Segetibacter sp. 3557_3]TDH18036.1 hypothetical protein EXU57_24490 [Segetibacter sp. 3557_3]